MIAADATRLRTQIMEMARRLRREADSDEESWSRLLLLGAIDRYGVEATPSRLASAEGLRSSNLARSLGDLEARGFITRTPDRLDRRKVRVSLTDVGRGVLQDVRDRRDRWLYAATQAHLNHEEQALILRAGEIISRLARETDCISEER